MGPLLKDHARMGCAGILAMPNTGPPVAKIHAADDGPYEALETYIAALQKQSAGAFDTIIVPLYLTADTTPQMIEAGVKSGLLKACKYYPPHGTTGADFGAPLQHFIDNGVFAAMQDHGVVLCVHGEEHGLAPAAYFDQNQNAEVIFYRERLPRVREKFPKLKIVSEHVTTKEAVQFVNDGAVGFAAATITPQHLLYTVGDLLKGLRYHLFCLPLLKFIQDREALRAAVMEATNTRFFAGTDSAPHTDKMTPCGCAAGCYTGGIAPQLYAEAFELAGADFTKETHRQAFKRFLCDNGPAFYGLRPSTKTFALEKKPQKVEALKIGGKSILPLPLGLLADQSHGATIPWSIVSTS